MRNDSKYEMTKTLISETGAGEPEREMVCLREAGGWYVRGRVNMGRVRVRSVVRQEIWVANRWNEGR